MDRCFSGGPVALLPRRCARSEKSDLAGQQTSAMGIACLRRRLVEPCGSADVALALARRTSPQLSHDRARDPDGGLGAPPRAGAASRRAALGVADQRPAVARPHLAQIVEPELLGRPHQGLELDRTPRRGYLGMARTGAVRCCAHEPPASPLTAYQFL